MKRLFVLLGLLLFAARVNAQPAPTIVSTLQTTNTSTTSLQVGCAIGSSTCTGGIVAGPIIGSALGAESGYVEIQSNVPVSTTFRLYNNAGTLFWNGSAVAIGGSISGTTNTVGLFTSSSSIGNSIMTQSGTTITVASTLNATNLGGTLSTASQPNVTGLGTIVSGTWGSAATKIGLASGGTNADLSGTGGTSQFLRQNSVGAAVTVVRPAVADLSDNSNVALLNAANVFTNASGQAIRTSVSGAGLILLINNQQAAAAGQFAGLEIDADNSLSVQTLFRQYSASASIGYTGGPGASNGVSVYQGNATPGIAIAATNASGAIGFYTGGTTVRWGINSAGDFTFGASSHLADSSGTPTIASGFGTGPSIAGTDYAFAVTIGTGASVLSGVVNFGHTWTTAPVCVGSATTSSMAPLITNQSTTTQLTITFTTGNWATQVIPVLCRGF